MSGRSRGIGALLTSVTRLARRPRLVLLAAAGVAAAVPLAVWLVTASPKPVQVEVEVALPPPAAEERPVLPEPPQPAAGSTDPAIVRPGAGNALTVPPVAADAFAAIPLPPPVAALPPAPDPALVETTAEGPLPKRGADGRLPWQVYARPAGSVERPAVAVVVTGLGRSAIISGEIIRRLPADVTLAFEPVADAADWGRRARSAGHEILLSLPVQGNAFPFVDRGPEALAGEADAAARLRFLLSRLAGYVGAIADVGAEEAGGTGAPAPASLALAGGELAARGLLLVSPFLEKAAAGEAPQLRVDLVIGPDESGAGARARLAELEAVAAAKGHALAVLAPTPAAAEALASWAAALPGKPVVLAPVTAVADRVRAHGH